MENLMTLDLLTILIVLVFCIGVGCVIDQFSIAMTAIKNHKKHGTYDKTPDLIHTCLDCKRSLVKKDNGNYYCAWCDVEYRTSLTNNKHIHET